MVITWGIAYLMFLLRICAEVDANLFFRQDEIHGTYL